MGTRLWRGKKTKTEKMRQTKAVFLAIICDLCYSENDFFISQEPRKRGLHMQRLEEKIRQDGVVKAGGVLKVDSFLNHQMDVAFFGELAQEFYRLFGGCGVTKILTIEASGIGIACITAQPFGVPVIFAKKTKTKNIAGEVYTSRVESFTHGVTYDIIVSKEFLRPEDRVLIIDDFLANGSALLGLSKLVKDAGATLIGAGIVIEKAFQTGGELVRSQGIRVESLARIAGMNETEGVTFIR